MLVDLHCHTAPYSPCSSLAPEELIDLARERGLEGICLTEHDTWWPAPDLDRLARRTGFVVLAGVELTTDIGHLLAFGLPRPPHSLATAAAARQHADVHDALLVLAHPARDGLLRVDGTTLATADAVECANGSDSRLQNMAAAGIGRSFRLPGTGGSDAHSPAEVGRAATRFDAPVRDTPSLLAALRAGAYAAWSAQ